MTETLTVTVALYQLDHLSARFRHELPGVVATPPGFDLITGVDHARVGIDVPLREWAALGRPGTVTLTIEPGTVPPASAVHQYLAGEEDPTPILEPDSYCNAPFGTGAAGGARYRCTWAHGHDGPHVAGDHRVILAVWGINAQTSVIVERNLIQPDTTPPASTERLYKVGDPDPTPDLHVDNYCMARVPGGGGNCTWAVHHDGPHVVGNGEIIVATWEN